MNAASSTESTALYQQALDAIRGLLDEARAAGEHEPTAMTLATSDVEGRLSARIVLLKAFDERGFRFYTNYDGAKAHQLAEHPKAALCLLWKTLRDGVQVRIEGDVSRTSAEDSDAYFASRPRDSQIGAWASLQSQTLPSRDVFEQRIAQFEQRFAGVLVPRPPHWGGYCVAPDMIELWYGVRARLHERIRYEGGPNGWSQRMLYP